ncbi:MAG: hypothetical protein ACI8UO_005560 [Verrucomicrobiales bacterium]|jgi:hypothetical protein
MDVLGVVIPGLATVRPGLCRWANDADDFVARHSRSEGVPLKAIELEVMIDQRFVPPLIHRVGSRR